MINKMMNKKIIKLKYKIRYLIYKQINKIKLIKFNNKIFKVQINFKIKIKFNFNQ